VASLKPLIGQEVLAVMGKGTAKAGQSAPWMLIDASDDEELLTAANDYLGTTDSEPKPGDVDPKQGLLNALKGLPGSTVVN
jgi:hypothetical protein